MEQTELIFPDFIREDIIALPNYSLRRVNTTSGRHYLVTELQIHDEETVSHLVPSVTTVVKGTSPTSPFIINKMIEMGKEKWDQYLNERSEYGTVMHILISELVRAQQMTIPLSVEEIAEIGIHNKGFNYKIFERFKEDLYSDLLSFAAFYHEYKVQPIALELPLASFEHRFAGTLDMPCLMALPTKGYWGEVYKSGPQKGTMKETVQLVEVLALVDFKSGRHGFYRDHEVQLKMCEVLFRDNYPEICDKYPVKLFNWAPKAWKTEPSYSLTDQTGKVSAESVRNRVSLFSDENPPVFKSNRTISGTIVLGEQPEGFCSYEDAI